MKATKSIALTAILSGSLAALTTASIASDSGLPSSTNWQAWNNYMAQPSQSQVSRGTTGLPTSTNWQSWNAYMAEPSQGGNTMTQNSLPSSTNWQQWNQYITTTN